MSIDTKTKKRKRGKLILLRLKNINYIRTVCRYKKDKNRGIFLKTVRRHLKLEEF
jgi:hypothetical protein